MELICGSLVTAYRHGENLQARSAMLMGSILAGIFFSHSDVASVHYVAEALGGAYDLPHGLCNAIFLPCVMEYNMAYCEKKYARIARAMGLAFADEAEGAFLAVRKVQELTRELNLPSFSALNVPETSFEMLAERSEKNGSNGSNPRPMTKQDYMEVLQRAYTA